MERRKGGVTTTELSDVDEGVDSAIGAGRNSAAVVCSVSVVVTVLGLI